VLERHEAITSRVKALTETRSRPVTTRMDDIEKKLNRGKPGGGWGDTDEGTNETPIDFWTIQGMRRRQA
jgi:hypothetical protein